MWTQQHRERQQEVERRAKRYPSDLTDAEWPAIEPLLPSPVRRGRRRQSDMREVINALRYLGACRVRPAHAAHPLWTLADHLLVVSPPHAQAALCHTPRRRVTLMLDREREGRKKPCASAGVIDSQSVKAAQARARGWDAAKKTAGRKRYIAVDTGGRLLMVNLTSADMADSARAIAVLEALKKRWPGLKHFFADGAYDRTALMDKAQMLGFVVEVVRRHKGQAGFQVLPQRWVVEQTFGWMIRHRRLVRD